MKLFTKISLIIAAVAGGIGILAVMIGLVMGANVKDLSTVGIYISPNQQVAVKQDADKKSMTELEGALIIHGSDRHHNEKLHDHCHSFKGIKRLEVDVQNAQITIFATENTEDFLYYSDREKSIAKVEGSTLKLEDHSSLQDKIELEIYVPLGVLKEIEIEAVNGTVMADKIVADNVSVEIDNAAVQIDELVVENQTELHISAGQMIIGYYEGKKLETECDMGSIMVVCEGKQSDYNYDLECGMGQIQINNDSYSGIGKNLEIQSGTKKFIKARCALGEIRIEFPNNL